MESDRIAKRLYVGECSEGQPRKEEGMDTVKDCLKKKREVWLSGKQGEWCMIGVNCGGL